MRLRSAQSNWHQISQYIFWFFFPVAIFFPPHKTITKSNEENQNENAENENIWQNCWKRKSNQIKENCEMREKSYQLYQAAEWIFFRYFHVI